jgi:hypothetical protein
MSNTGILNSILSDFYKSTGLDPDDLEKKVNQNVMKSYDAYILPLKLSNEEKRIKTHIAHIVRNPVQPVNIAPFPVETLQNVLNLQPPKKVIEYTGPTQLESADLAKKERQSRRPYGRRAGRTRLSKEIPKEVASIYAEEETNSAANQAKRQKLLEKDDENEMRAN